MKKTFKLKLVVTNLSKSFHGSIVEKDIDIELPDNCSKQLLLYKLANTKDEFLHDLVKVVVEEKENEEKF